MDIVLNFIAVQDFDRGLLFELTSVDEKMVVCFLFVFIRNSFISQTQNYYFYFIYKTQILKKFFLVIKKGVKLLWTPNSLESLLFQFPSYQNNPSPATLATSSAFSSISFPLNLYLSGELFLPLGRPKIIPSDFFRASASFVYIR